MIKSLLPKFKKTQIKTENKVISSLAPKVLSKAEDIEKIQTYLDKLNETINAKNINNIALTGGYGSGKSTIIGTFKELNTQHEFLNISLASFNKKKSDDILTASEKKIQKEELERLLEVSILQQIFYHVKPKEIPESRFKRIINISDRRIFGISICFILWVISSVLLFKYDYLDKINPKSWDTKYSFDWYALLIFVIAFIGLGLFSKLLIKLFSNSKINKVNIKGELELGDNVNKSVFNEHLEEILYFFEMTKYNVVIIEDLDRFDSTDIFTKLREINILLNNSKLIDREINFVYAVGDDLFGDKKERVKFFEYIIPVIPFINSSNADEQLRTLIKESGLDENIFTKEFISDVTTFIDDIDMRLLTNIFHEFVIYRKTLRPEFIKKNDELFAMITYKNIDPKDFTELNRKEGKLYKLINNKKSYIKEFINKIDKEIQSKNSQIKDIEKQNIIDVKELRTIYLNRVIMKLPSDSVLEQDFSELLEEEGFEKLISQSLTYKKFNQIHYQTQYQKSQNNILSYDFKQIENEINSKYSYEERIELITSKHKNIVELLKNEIDELKSKKAIIENWDLKQIFNEIDINEHLKDFSNNGLLRNLILNGYINENYNDYISLFHEVSITKEDFTFERNIKSGYTTEFNYKLSDKIENLIERIHLRYFERETILNFDLLDYLGNNYSRYSDKYDSIIRLLSNEKENSIRFIEEYIKDEDRPIGIFIEKLVENWKGFVDFIYWKGNYGREAEDKYLELIIRFSESETIIKNQNTTTLKNAIEDTSYFLSLIKNTEKIDYFEKITKLLNHLKIKFEGLDNPTEEVEKLFEFIYNNSHYKINGKNLLQMLSKFSKENIEDKFTNSNYSTILNSDCKPLIGYVNSNIKTYTENVYLKLEDNNLEDEISLIELLNNEDLDDKLRIKIIQKVETKITDLSNIDELEIKKQLLINNKVIPTWNNVINYYTDCQNKIDDTLIKFLEFEDVNSKLSKIKLLKENKVFEESMLVCNEISDETYEKLIKSSYFNWNKLGFENLSDEKVLNLIDMKLILTKSNYDLLKEYHADFHISLVEKYFNSFIDNIDDFETDNEDVLMLLKSNEIKNDNKFRYISEIVDESIIVSNSEISKIVGNVILQKSEFIEFDINTIKSIVKDLNSTENKIRFLNLYFNGLNDSQVISLLKTIWSYNKLFEKGKPTYLKSNYNDLLLKRLKSRELIRNYYDDSWSDSKFRVTTNY